MKIEIEIKLRFFSPLGVLDILLSLPSVIICLREICQCYNPTKLWAAQRRAAAMGGAGYHHHQSAAAEGGAGGEWGNSWMGGQQNNIFYRSLDCTHLKSKGFKKSLTSIKISYLTQPMKLAVFHLQ